MEIKLPKYQQLVNWVKKDIQSGNKKPGDKFYSENQLAASFGVSRQTVRQALGILAQESYIESRQGSGTFVLPTQKRQGAKTMTVGVVSTYVDDYIFPPIIGGIGKALSRQGYSMQLYFTQNRVENEMNALKSMMQQGVDGIVVEPTKSRLPNPNAALYRQIVKQNIPVIFFNAYYPELNFPHISLDDKAAGKLVTQYLIKKGHKKIAGLFQSDDLQGHLRYNGYIQALIEKDILLNADRVFWFATEDIQGMFVNNPRIESVLCGATAVVCYNDQIAATLIEHLKKSGKNVPGDISVIGIDNSANAERCNPPLTSVNHPKEILGRAVAENIIKKINMQMFDATIEFEPKLVKRASVAQQGGA